MADILTSDVYKARNGVYKAQLHELYCRMPNCDANFNSDGELQLHLDITHASNHRRKWSARARGTYRGKDLMNFYFDLMRHEDYPGKNSEDGRIGDGGAGTMSQQRPRRNVPRPQYGLFHPPTPELGDDEDDDEELPERLFQRQDLDGVDGASEHQTPATRVINRGNSLQMEVGVPAYEEEEQELEFKRKELDIERRRLELEQRDLQLQREQAVLKKRRAAQ